MVSRMTAFTWSASARGFLNAQTGASAHVQANLPGVDLRKEIAAENADEQNGTKRKCQETCGEELRRMQGDYPRLSVAIPEFFKPRSKPC